MVHMATQKRSCQKMKQKAYKIRRFIVAIKKIDYKLNEDRSLAEK